MINKMFKEGKFLNFGKFQTQCCFHAVKWSLIVNSRKYWKKFRHPSNQKNTCGWRFIAFSRQHGLNLLTKIASGNKQSGRMKLVLYFIALNHHRNSIPQFHFVIETWFKVDNSSCWSKQRCLVNGNNKRYYLCLIFIQIIVRIP